MGVLVRAFPGSSPVASAPIPAPLPATLIIPPGVYNYGGLAWDCRAERAYSLWQPGIDRAYRIVWSSDIPALMASLSWITAIGMADNAVPVATLTTTARYFKPRLLCGQTVAWARSICAGLGIASRVVRALTASEPNNYYDGHVMMEVKIDGAWRLFDLASGRDFPVGNSSARDVLPLRFTSDMRRISEKSIAVEQIASSLFDPLVWQEMTLSNADDSNAEWLRVLQIPGVDRANGDTAFWLPPGTEGRAAWLQSLSPAFKIITRDAWLAEFYPGGA